MPYPTSSMIPEIESCYSSFTPAEQTIANFFIENRDVADLSFKKLSAELHISTASLVRFAQKLGYSGYREFVFQYRKSLAQKEEPAKSRLADSTQSVLDCYQELLDKSCSLVDEQQITRVVRLIAQKSRVFFYGMGSSGLVAQEIASRFIRIGVDAESVVDSHKLLMNHVRLDDNCLVIAISISGTTREIVEALEKAHQNGAASVLVTSMRRPAQQADLGEVMLVAVKERMKYGEAISPQFAALLLMDVLYAHYVQQDSESIQQMYGGTLDALGLHAGEASNVKDP